jgi:hypothetical protein
MIDLVGLYVALVNRRTDHSDPQEIVQDQDEGQEQRIAPDQRFGEQSHVTDASGTNT